MFALDGVALRPLEVSDIDSMYAWSVDNELNVLAGWGRPRSRGAFHQTCRAPRRHRHRSRRQGDMGRGVGGAALRILADYAFAALNLERVYAEVYGFNLRSQRLMERVGFRREGVLRQHETHNGVRQDVHVFGLLKAEFYQRYLTLFEIPTSAVSP